MARIVLCDPPPLREVLPEVPAALERLVARMLAKRREDRPRDAAAVASELGAVAAPAAPVRRRAGSEESPTTVDTERLPVAGHVIFVQATEVAVDVEPLVARFGARAHRLANDTIVAVVDDVAVAADCALALARGLDPAPVALVGPSDPHEAVAPLEVLLDTGAGELEAADLQRIFGGAALPPGAVRVDATTAGRLAGRFEVREDQGIHHVIGRKSP